MDWPAILDKYGYPTLLLFLGGLLFYRKVWPLFEKFILGILEQLTAMTKAMEKMGNTLDDIGKRTEDNLREIQRIADKEHKQ